MLRWRRIEGIGNQRVQDAVGHLPLSEERAAFVRLRQRIAVQTIVAEGIDGGFFGSEGPAARRFITLCRIEGEQPTRREFALGSKSAQTT